MRTLLTPTRVLVVLALVLALGGTAAAGTGLINGSQIKNGTLTKSKFARGVLTAGTRGATGATGPPGAQGATGSQGVAGPPSPTTAVRYIKSSSGVGPVPGSNDAHTVITL